MSQSPMRFLKFKRLSLLTVSILLLSLGALAEDNPVHSCFFEEIYGEALKNCFKGRGEPANIIRPDKADWIKYNPDSGWSGSSRIQHLTSIIDFLNSGGYRPADLGRDAYCQSIHDSGVVSSGDGLSDNFMSSLYSYRQSVMMYGIEVGISGCF